MRYLFILLLLSGCASYQAGFNADLETVQGVEQTVLVETWGDPFAAGTLEDGMDYARFVFANDANQRFKCHVDVLFEENAAVHALWGGYCAWDETAQKPIAQLRWRGLDYNSGHGAFPALGHGSMEPANANSSLY